MGMAVDDRLECFGDVAGRIDVVEFAGGNDRRQKGPIFGADFMSDDGWAPKTVASPRPARYPVEFFPKLSESYVEAHVALWLIAAVRDDDRWNHSSLDAAASPGTCGRSHAAPPPTGELLQHEPSTTISASRAF